MKKHCNDAACGFLKCKDCLFNEVNEGIFKEYLKGVGHTRRTIIHEYRYLKGRSLVFRVFWFRYRVTNFGISVDFNAKNIEIRLPFCFLQFGLSGEIAVSEVCNAPKA